MKKMCFLLAVCLLFVLAGCGDSDYVRIDSYSWEVVTVDVVNNETFTSEFVACSPAFAECSGLTGLVEELDLKILAGNGKITITDETNGMVYEGTYEQISQTGNTTAFEKSTSYQLNVDGVIGTASTHNEISNVAVPGGRDSFWAGDGVPVLQITIGDYSLYCMEEGFVARKLLVSQ